ncbi:SPFH domain-containing protein [Gallibacter sp. Marseille-QA0791]|uniref:SPFH domain-containing protein n=1 Tax=Gallibacter sp. Marseille-QA0791 TaxID=3378781 RepID=UPI003D10A90A
METNNMIKRDIVERELHPVSGMAMMVISAVGILAGIGLCIAGPVMFDGGTAVLLATAGVLLFLVFLVCMCGLKIVNPNEALVLTLFGKYHGTIKKDGFFFVNPFVAGFNPTARGTLDTIKEEMVEASKKDGHKKSSKSNAGKKVSTKTMTLNNAQQKVNDVQGNPVVIGSIVIWRVANPTKAVFNVENYFEYLSIQCDSTIRNTARLYPYDTIDQENDEMTLRGSSLEIAQNMKAELQDKVADAGIEILEVRITHLAYSEEIAAAMLKRQQAAATIAAREKIVEGAVGMVRMALDKLEDNDLVVLDDERKAAMVSNLLVVLCGDKEPQPIVNSGSIY